VGLKLHGQSIFALYPSTYFIDLAGCLLGMNLRSYGFRCDRGGGNVFLRVISSYD
jgi:hypothetical protein